MTKQELREVYLTKRSRLSEAEYFQQSKRICDYFFLTIDLSFINVVHTFLPITEKKEPDLWPLIDRLRREFPHIQICIPKIADNEINSFFFQELHQLKKNNWGIMEPRSGIPVSAEKIDLVLVPTIAADQKGNRIGYGKGFYDRFLVQCPIHCLKIGVSFFRAEENIPKEDHDVKLNALITPNGITYF